jgi:hypothetical protein
LKPNFKQNQNNIMPPHSTIFISTCTSRKTFKSENMPCAGELHENSLEEAAKSWRSLIREQTELIEAKRLYCGTGFSNALRASTKLAADHWIISAGLGLIRADEKIPTYNLTLNGNGESGIRPRIKTDFNPQKWWEAINKSKSGISTIAKLVTSRPKAAVILALSKPYLELIVSDLAAIPEKQLNRIRIVGPAKSQNLPDIINDLILPYDERLDGPRSPNRGTKSDFAQRAALHFATAIWANNKNGSFLQHSNSLEISLNTMGRTVIRLGEKKTDAEICEVIKDNWINCKGQSTIMLRMLRHQFNYACEQTRFRKLFLIVRNEMKEM